MRVKNWDRWQSYRSDRGSPPWIKVHRCVLRNTEWVSLTDAQRGQLVAIWLLAADRNGHIPDDPELIQRLCLLTSPPDLTLLIEKGFLDAKTTPRRRQVGVTVTPQIRDRSRVEAEADTDSAASRLNGLQASFTEFWNIYPKKVGKGAAEKAWLKIHPDDALCSAIQSSLTIQIGQPQWLKDGGQFIPNPSTWLNQRRWEDSGVVVDRHAETRETINQAARILRIDHEEN